MLNRLIAVAAATLIATTAYAAEIAGAGATFPQPLYIKWADDYNKATGNKLNYQGIGSGAGLKQIDAKVVTFGATDIPVSDSDLDKKGEVQFPMVTGGIVAIVNLKDVDKLVLSTDILAKIYNEKIKRWNDSEIAALNPKTKLPDLPIIKIRRSDGSGTTWNFTKFLAEANSDWRNTYGFGASVEWAGSTIGAKGNDGVTGNVMQTSGSIGYVEYAYAKQNKLQTVDMIGTDGKPVSPNIASFQSTWPMVATTYIVMYKNPENKADSSEALKFFDFAYNNDASAIELDYIPLSVPQKEKVRKIWAEIK